MPSKVVLQATAFTVVVAALIMSAIRGSAPDTLSEWLAPVGPAVVAAGAGLWLFDRHAWRWPGLRRLVGRPLLHGTWHGTLASRWVNPDTNEGIAPDPSVFLVVRQRYWSVTVRQLTRESGSASIRADLYCNPDRVWQLVYLYSNVPRAEFRHRSEIHYGAAVLTAPGNGEAVAGHYFTDRNTMGDMTFPRHFAALVETHDGGMRLLG